MAQFETNLSLPAHHILTRPEENIHGLCDNAEEKWEKFFQKQSLFSVEFLQIQKVTINGILAVLVFKNLPYHPLLGAESPLVVLSDKPAYTGLILAKSRQRLFARKLAVLDLEIKLLKLNNRIH